MYIISNYYNKGARRNSPYFLTYFTVKMVENNRLRNTMMEWGKIQRGGSLA